MIKMQGDVDNCPFCNGVAILLQDEDTRKFAVWCSKCKASIEWLDTEAEVVDAWNRRHVDVSLLTGTMELLANAELIMKNREKM